MSDEYFSLSPGERDSAMWKRLEAHLKAMRDDLRIKNDSQRLDHGQTQYIRGRISILEAVIGFGKPPTNQATANRRAPASDMWQLGKESL